MYTNRRREEEEEMSRAVRWLMESEGLTEGEARTKAAKMKAEAEAEAEAEARRKRLEEARLKRRGWEKARTGFREEYLKDLNTKYETLEEAKLEILADIAQALKDISYGQILKSQAAARKYQNQNSYRK